VTHRAGFTVEGDDRSQERIDTLNGAKSKHSASLEDHAMIGGR